MPRITRSIARLSDAQLLRQRVCDLAPAALGGMVAAQVQGLYADLDRAGLSSFRPEVYLGDEWFSPDGVAAIAVPFYLAHPRLALLERRYMREVEGGRPRWCRMLLRHEAGHCFDHAFAVSRSSEWRRLFGPRRRRYDPDAFVPDAARRHDFVQHLPGDYAQAHPDEDFAETFAVCITPGLAWRSIYRHRPVALEKLEYVAGLIANHRDATPRGAHGDRSYAAARMRVTLARYYERRLDEKRRADLRVKRLAAAGAASRV